MIYVAWQGIMERKKISVTGKITQIPTLTNLASPMQFIQSLNLVLISSGAAK